MRTHKKLLQISISSIIAMLALLPNKGSADSFTAGDANYDCSFDSSDLVAIFQAGKYETGLKANWREGDFDKNGFFDSSDLVAAFQGGKYETGSTCNICFASRDTAIASCNALSSSGSDALFKDCTSHTMLALSKCSDYDSIANVCNAATYTLDYALSTPSQLDDGQAVNLNFSCLTRLL